MCGVGRGIHATHDVLDHHLLVSVSGSSLRHNKSPVVRESVLHGVILPSESVIYAPIVLRNLR